MSRSTMAQHANGPHGLNATQGIGKLVCRTESINPLFGSHLQEMQGAIFHWIQCEGVSVLDFQPGGRTVLKLEFVNNLHGGLYVFTYFLFRPTGTEIFEISA